MTWCQAIIWINAGIMLIRTIGTNFNEILSNMRFHSTKCIWKCHLSYGGSLSWYPPRAGKCLTNWGWLINMSSKMCHHDFCGRGGSNLKSLTFKLIVQNSSLDNHCKIALKWMPENSTNEKSTLTQVIVWWCQATCHYLNQCWLRYLMPYVITRSHWGNPTLPGCSQSPCQLTPGPHLNIKTVLSTYGDFHVKDKTAVRTSYL